MSETRLSKGNPSVLRRDPGVFPKLFRERTTWLIRMCRHSEGTIYSIGTPTFNGWRIDVRVKKQKQTSLSSLWAGWRANQPTKIVRSEQRAFVGGEHIQALTVRMTSALITIWQLSSTETGLTEAHTLGRSCEPNSRFPYQPLPKFHLPSDRAKSGKREDQSPVSLIVREEFRPSTNSHWWLRM